MRAIGALEQKIINTICLSEPTSIAQLLCNNIPNLNLKIDNTENVPLGNEYPVKVELILPNSADLREIEFEQTKQILYILNFLIYLEEEGYILSGYFAHGRIAKGYFSSMPNFETYLNSGEAAYTHFQFPDARFRQLIFEYADRLIVPTHHLVSFKKRGFKTQEAKQHSEMLWVTWVAVGVSLILGILALFF